MAENELGLPFIHCPVCEGSGKKKTGFDCPNCNGMGMGSFQHGRFFYWGPKLGKAVIELDHLRHKFHLIINFDSLEIHINIRRITYFFLRK